MAATRHDWPTVYSATQPNDVEIDVSDLAPAIPRTTTPKIDPVRLEALRKRCERESP